MLDNRDTEGNRQLRVFWLDEDVTDQTKDFETLIQQHPTLKEILRLRAVSVVQQCLQEQLEKLASNSALDSMTAGDFPLVREECFDAALLLRGVERGVLEAGVDELENEVSLIIPFLFVYLDPMSRSHHRVFAMTSVDDHQLPRKHIFPSSSKENPRTIPTFQ